MDVSATYKQSESAEITSVREPKTSNFKHLLEWAHDTEHSDAPTQPDHKNEKTSGQGQKPLNAAMLNVTTFLEQKQILGKQLYPLIKRMSPDLAKEVTDVLLEIDNSNLIHMLEDQELLKDKVKEAVAMLRAHQDNNNSKERSPGHLIH